MGPISFAEKTLELSPVKQDSEGKEMNYSLGLNPCTVYIAALF